MLKFTECRENARFDIYTTLLVWSMTEFFLFPFFLPNIDWFEINLRYFFMEYFPHLNSDLTVAVIKCIEFNVQPFREFIFFK